MSAGGAAVVNGEAAFSTRAAPVSVSHKVVIAHSHPFEVWTAPAWLSERMAQDFPRLNVVHLPVTPETVALMHRGRIAKMKPDAYLINVGRGELIDEPALLDALQNRRIAGAALDALNQEPLSSESPFWSLDNVLITPHFAAATEAIWDLHYQLIFENFTRFLGGRPLLSEVDKHRGY